MCSGWESLALDGYLKPSFSVSRISYNDDGGLTVSDLGVPATIQGIQAGQVCVP